jgi:hypothetical protein
MQWSKEVKRLLHGYPKRPSTPPSETSSCIGRRYDVLRLDDQAAALTRLPGAMRGHRQELARDDPQGSLPLMRSGAWLSRVLWRLPAVDKDVRA